MEKNNSTLNIISFNIRFDNPNDGKHSWKSRLPLVSKWVNKQAPDLLSTQEGMFKQTEQLKNSLNNLVLSDSHRNWQKKRMYPCIFFNPHKFQLIESGDIWFCFSKASNLGCF